jgi:hypothetical protein
MTVSYQVKHSVRQKVVHHSMWWAEMVVGILFQAHELQATITSRNDSTHSTKSLHYENLAFDVRLKDVPQVKRGVLRAQIARALGDDYDVLLEHPTHPYNVHLHIEFDKK